MSFAFEAKNRILLPRWRDFSTTLKLGELKPLNIKKTKAINPSALEQNIADWNKNKSFSFAADLVNAAFSNDLYDYAKDAAQFIINGNFAKHDSSIYKMALSVSGESVNYREHISIANHNSFALHQKIHDLKKRLIVEPRNSIGWIDLALLYTLNGQLDKADIAARISVNLSPDNRHILRCASRFFIHVNDKESALRILRKSPATKTDPWLMAAEISVSAFFEKSSKLIKSGIATVNSGNFSPADITELSGAVGTEEIRNGSYKKAKELFWKSLVRPNENSLAQADWAANKVPGLIVNIKNYNIPRVFEAKAIKSYYDSDTNTALTQAAAWVFDQPFAKRATILSSHILTVFNEDYQTSIDFLDRGLKSHPNSASFLNNLAYNQLLLGKTEEAEKTLFKIDEHSLSEYNRIPVLATIGLLSFRKGDSENGLIFYSRAIEKAKAIKNKYLVAIAQLNLGREQIISNSKPIDEVVSATKDVCKNVNEPDIIFLESKLEERLSRIKQSQLK